MCLNLLNYLRSGAMQLDLGKKVRQFLVLNLLMVIGFTLNAQQLKPEGFFQQDSFKLGKPVPYTLSFRYPSELNVIFPDSTYNFAPFELSYRDYFNTRSDSASSFDSVVYYLRTFKLDTVQKLTLPVFVVKNGDSTAIYASTDSLIFNQVVPVLPDSVNLQETSYLHEVKREFNYPYAIAITIGVVSVISIIIALFGGGIRRTLRLRKLNKDHEKYLAKYYALLDRSNGEGKNKSEEILITWKQYLEKLEKAPYTKQTTKEIVAMHPDQKLKDALRSIDRDIYAGKSSENIEEEYRSLLEYSINSFRNKVEAIKHGT